MANDISVTSDASYGEAAQNGKLFAIGMGIMLNGG